MVPKYSRRILAIILAVVMILSLSACGNEKKEEAKILDTVQIALNGEIYIKTCYESEQEAARYPIRIVVLDDKENREGESLREFLRDHECNFDEYIRQLDENQYTTVKFGYNNNSWKATAAYAGLYTKKSETWYKTKKTFGIFPKTYNSYIVISLGVTDNPDEVGVYTKGSFNLDEYVKVE